MFKRPMITLLAGSLLVAPAANAFEFKPQPTKVEVLDQSLEDLLNEGYDIVSGDVQSSLILRRQSGSGVTYVACIIELTESSASCWRLN